ncbi:MAG TPA: 1-deoxy-D-xylulose-5-phosphate reductoisomerase [Mariprofundaceae bacterium]|nr:1-deoxy-D-xylulose-5-phosphate reductoisomerase [Mariprofundaceae bacterium]
MKSITVLGATGSIGASTADIMLRHRDLFTAYALVGHRNVARMRELAETLHPQWVVMTDEEAAREIKGTLPEGVRLEAGMDAAIAMAEADDVDMVMAAMVGSVGLPAALAAVKAGKRVGLANKECLVTAGRLFMCAASEAGADVVPVDSEHAAVHQCLTGHDRGSVSRIILTASGGPFRDRDPATLEAVTPEEAVAHPNWDMGAKISIDSATMMNKALELIEARWLFDMPPEKLEAVIHPQSIVHALVEYRDGSMLAQLAEPDMRAPVAYALQTDPRLNSGITALDLARHGRLDFKAIDDTVFPAVRLAQTVMRCHDSVAVAFNAANEVANQAFRQGHIPFTAILKVVEHAVSGIEDVSVDSLDQVWSCDHEARQFAATLIDSRKYLEPLTVSSA